MGCCRWWWNYALNASIETYKATGKGLERSELNALLPNLKKEHECSLSRLLPVLGYQDIVPCSNYQERC